VDLTDSTEHGVTDATDEVFSQWEETSSVPGVAYGVVRNGVLVHAGGLGVASVDGTTPGADTVFRIASMTKSFTALAVLLLRDEGALRLDDPLAAYLPVAAVLDERDGPPLTLRDLLTMGAGLATDDPWGDRQESLPIADFDALVAGGLSACWPNRTAFEYSNTSYALLGRVIEQVSGVDFPIFVRERLCVPLGMTDTVFDPKDVPADRRATGYRITADGTPVPEPLVAPGAYSAMGGLLSSVRDLATWVGGFTESWTDGGDGHPVDQWSRREAQEMARFIAVEPLTDGGTVAGGYGFGLGVQQHSVLGRIVSHSGGYPGFGSHMRWHPASGWGVVALGNSTYAPMHVPVADALSRIVTMTDAAHGESPAVVVEPWPATIAAMDVVEQLLAGDDSGVVDSTWSPNMDLDIPRAERIAQLSGVREAVGAFTRDDASVRHPSPARAAWTVAGETGSARLEVWMTPERHPRIQKLVATRVSDPAD
jgi:CubicO group peptidase (beta-lactamase class C family)